LLRDWENKVKIFLLIGIIWMSLKHDLRLYRCQFWGFHGGYDSSWRWRQHRSLKALYPTTTLHGVSTQNTSTWSKIHCP